MGEVHLKRAYIEILNTCNLRCSFCVANKRPPRMMTVAEVGSILKQLQTYTDHIFLHVQGEPLMHPHLDEILSLCDKGPWHVHLVTNGTCLADWPGLLKHPSLYKVSFSIQSVEFQDPDYVVPCFEEILRFCQAASQQKHPFCELRFWRIEQTGMPQTARCLEILDRRFPPVQGHRDKQYILMPYVQMDIDHPFEWPDNEHCEGSSVGTCHGARDQIAVLSDGSVVPCCLDINAEICLGNIFNEPLETILNSERYQKMADGFRHHRINEPFCRKCTFHHQFD